MVQRPAGAPWLRAVNFLDQWGYGSKNGVDYSGRIGDGLAQNVHSLSHLRNLCFGLVPVATRRSRQRIPVIRRVAGALHLLEYGIGIGFAACGPQGIFVVDPCIDDDLGP